MEKEKAQMYLDIAGVILVVLDNKQNVVLLNKRGCAILGYDEKDVLGKNWIENFIPRDFRNKVKSAAESFSRGEIKYIKTLENPILTKSGEERLILWDNVELKNDKGEIIGTLSSGEDITERREFENQLIKAKEVAENANQSKGQFLASMSHEIRTPLNAIVGLTKLLADGVNDPIQNEYFDLINKSSDTLLSLINDVLDFSKIEAGEIVINLDFINFLKVVDEIKSIFAHEISNKNLAFKFEHNLNQGELFNLDELRIRQVLFNLLSNAIKFTDSGYIKLGVKKTVLENSLYCDLEIWVEDTGIGIPTNNQELIFEAFKQQDGQDSRKFGGTGLGLSICSKLVSAMNGEIKLKSSINNGSIFTIKLKKIDLQNLKSDNRIKKITDNSEKNYKFNNIENEDLINLPEAIKVLENKILADWKNIVTNKNFAKIENFSQNIIKTGEKNAIEIVKKFGEELLSFVKSFNVEKISEILESFPEFIEHLKKQI